MKGVILAGGTGSRLMPITKVTNKHLLPIYNKPMIYYPIMTLLQAGLSDVLIISGPEHAGHFLNLLGSGRDFNARFHYDIQEQAGGIAQALGLAEDYIDGEPVTVILGDNIFADDVSQTIQNFSKKDRGAHIFLSKVPDPQRFGVAELEGDRVVGIEEKPKVPKSSYAVAGLYCFDHTVFSIIKDLKPSARGEYEITDVINVYVGQKNMCYTILQKPWTDAGTFESLYRANQIARDIAQQSIQRQA